MNNDSYLRGGHNFYLYLDPKDDKFRFIPWDQDLSMGSRPGGRGGGVGAQLDVMRPFTGDQPLLYWLLDDPASAAQYRAIVRELGTSVFTETRFVEAGRHAREDRHGPRPVTARVHHHPHRATCSSSSRAWAGSKRHYLTRAIAVIGTGGVRFCP